VASRHPSGQHAWTDTLARPRTGALLIAFALLPATAPAGSVIVQSDARESHEISSGSNFHLYETVVAFRDSHPHRFDRNHVFYFHLLTETPVMDWIVSDWEARRRRFDYWNPFLYRVLDGYTIFLDRQFVLKSDPPPETTLSSKGRQDPAGRIGGGATGTGRIDPQSVPEPSPAILLLIASTTFLALAVIHKRTLGVSPTCPHPESTSE
jgi:hypothetical protein